MAKKAKLGLDALKVQNFVTSADDDEKGQLGTIELSNRQEMTDYVRY